MIVHPHLEDGVGCWAERRTDRNFSGRPALFLDRDGVVVEEAHFLSRVEDIRLITGIADAIAAVNRLGLPVIVVSNQSGIARGHFDWTVFASVQAAITARLEAQGARLDAVMACGYHPACGGPLGVGDHAWRKPNPGMMHRARDMFDLDLSRSFIVGDRITDLQAGANASLNAGALVMTGYGREQAAALGEARALWSGTFGTSVCETAPEAIGQFLALVRAMESRTRHTAGDERHG